MPGPNGLNLHESPEYGHVGHSRIASHSTALRPEHQLTLTGDDCLARAGGTVR